jgi:ABC-2 type transport system permease protein
VRAERPAAVPLSHFIWLKWTLTRRGLVREKQRLIGSILLIVLVLPLALGQALLTYLGYEMLPTATGVELLFAVVTILFAGWLIVPIFLYNLNESLDVSRLFLFPISGPRLMTVLLVTSVLDVPAFFLLAFFIAIVAGWVNSAGAAVVVLLALAILYGQMVAGSQLLLSLLNSVLRSRRFRDIAFILVAAFGGGFYLWQQVAIRQLSNLGLTPRQLFQVRISPWLQWSPPGAVARAIQGAYDGAWLSALAWLALAAAMLALLVLLWHRALIHLMTTAEIGGGAKRRVVERAPARASWSALRLPLSRAVLTLAAKDLRYYWRDPQLKAIIINATLALAVLLAAPWLGFRRGPDLSQAAWLVFGLPLPVAMTTLSLAFNALGLERNGLRFLALLPVPPATILLGKNLAVGVVAAIETAVFGIAFGAFVNGWAYLPIALVGVVAAVLITLGTGNIVAVLLPARMPDGTRATFSAEVGCVRGLLQMVAFLAVWLLLLPVGAAVVVPYLLHQPALYPLVLAVALGYAGAVYTVALHVISPVLQRRMPEILAIATRD